MLTHPTHDRLIALGLTGMAKALEDQRRQPDIAALAFDDRIAMMIDREAIERENKRLTARLKFACLRQSAIVEDVDMKAPRGLDKALFQKLAAGNWIDRHQNLIVIGPTGVGKSWLACALGHKACRDDRSVSYQRVPRLFDALALARGDGRHGRLLKTNVYVADRGNRRIQVFDGEGKLLRVITIDVPYDPNARPAIGSTPNPGTVGTMSPGAPWTVCITPGPNQVLYTSDAFPGRVYKLGLDGKVLGVLGESGKQLKQFGWIHEIACPSENELYVAELLNWRVQKLLLHPEPQR
jgi:hypothetical protein